MSMDDFRTSINVRIPFQDVYIYLLGVATYCFSYYEGTIVDILSVIDKDFRQKYYRKSAMTSGQLAQQFKDYLPHHLDIIGLSECHSDFAKMVDIRNRLIHGHPITDPIEGQILNYQASIKKEICDYKWTSNRIIDFILEIDSCESTAAQLLDRLRNT